MVDKGFLDTEGNNLKRKTKLINLTLSILKTSAHQKTLLEDERGVRGLSENSKGIKKYKLVITEQSQGHKVQHTENTAYKMGMRLIGEITFQIISMSNHYIVHPKLI